MADWGLGWLMKKFMEKIVDTGFGKIVDPGFEYLKDQVRWQTGMKEELQRLKEIYPEVQRVLAASSQSEIRDQNQDLDRWLWQLRDVVEEADDLLDKYEYLKHEEQLTRNTEQTKGKKRSITSLFNESYHKIRIVGERALKMDRNLNRLEEVVQKLVNVSADVAKYSDLFESTKQKMLLELNDIRETGASPTNNFIGRCEEMDYIMQWLGNSSKEDQSHITSSNYYKNISLLSIVGHGGMGKTTLSQHVYNNRMENEFDVNMWVCVSTNFDEKRVIAHMLESHKKSKCDLEALDALQGSLRSEVMAKKFLLVLDDIWEDEKDTSKWEKVFGPLAVGSLGSKILITTRMESVASMIANILSSKDHTILRLEGMKEDECLQLLNNYAFATVENPDAHKKSILEQIVKKVLGSPLAVKVIGGVLRDNMNESYWTTILNCDIGSIEHSQNIFFPILRLSYMFLPKPLQSCFSFCSIFPQDHEFDKDDLIRMWIALNFVHPSSNPKETPEDIGERYFDILVKKSFFEKFQDTFRTYYKMHDLLQELAQFVSARECCRVVGDEELSNCERIRHLSVKTHDLKVLRKIKNFKKLRSLFLFSYIDNRKDFADELSEIFKASSSIRLLFIDAECQMPEAIGDLIHLRYLKCHNGYYITQLPRSICTLYHMNFIIYSSHVVGFPDDFLPRDINNLFNLRYANLPWHKLPKMHFIGKLHPLQRLNTFFVKNEAGYRINELKHMNELCRIRIYQLENVKDGEEARSAKFCDKGSLMELSLQWSDNKSHRNIVHSNLDEEVFDNLQPHNNLKQLTINAYMGTRSAIWMNDVKFISNLERIRLEGCFEWQTLPPFGQLRSLKSLYLRKMPKAKSIDYGFHRNDEDCTFPSLKVLHIEDLDALEDWFDAAAAANNSLFPCLTELCLKRCPNLQELSSLPPKLRRLLMDNIRWKGFSGLQDTSNRCYVFIENCGDFPGIFSYFNTIESGRFKHGQLKIRDPSQLLMEPLRSITSVKELTICENDKFVSFPIETEEWFLQVSSSLCKLSFMILESLQSLPSSLKSLSSLEDLMLSNIPLLKSLPDLPSSLEELHLRELKSLQRLPSLLNISSLKHLSLEKIPLLKSLTDLPSSLKKLSIKNLESLECMPSSLSTSSSLQNLELASIPLLKSLSILPSSLEKLSIKNLESLECMPSSLSTFSSLNKLHLASIPLLKSLTELPSSLEALSIRNLESLECIPSSLSTFSSLKSLNLASIPLKSLPVLPPSLQQLSIENLESLECPSFSLSTLSSLKCLELSSIPLLKSFPDLPPSLERLYIENLKSLECLPSSLLAFSSLKYLKLSSFSLLKSLPVLPPSLTDLHIYNLESLECLPSSLSTISLWRLTIDKVPLLQQLPDLPSSLKWLDIKDCHEELRKRYNKISGFDRDKIAHIPTVYIY